MQTTETGTVEKNSTPGESKFDKATEAMSNLFHQKDTDLEESGTQDQKEEVKKPEEDDKKQDKPEEGNWENRYKHVQAFADKALTNAEKIALTMVEKDPESIHEIATLDPDLADKIIAKGLKESHGITTYAEFVEAVKKSTTTETESKVDPALSKRIEAVEADLENEKLEKSIAYVEKFRSENPDFEGDLENNVWELFNKSELTLEEAYDYVKANHSLSEKQSKAEEEAYKNLEKKNLASSFSSSKAIGTTDKKTKSVNKSTLNFLEAIGAKKTLAKHN